ncbi:uncharacterized protein LOC127261390 [Andrographis paniculata]|uniref:uncharacterized protein LOC127261390 n=1 Tax=Andrographis paniculata TaxID=175694 RepID=UPI0021E92364|nr:uncharacterized protein LOC127261390 [Andrographis paniculata]
MGSERFSLINGVGGGDVMHAGIVGSLPMSSPPSDALGVCVNGGGNYIIHTVSKFDTLAGVAIKYGVEVADIKRLNGLVTDLQMFALKTLQIPLPGRHPPSPCLSNGSDLPPRQSSSQRYASSRHKDIFDSFPSLKLKSSSARKVSSAMIKLEDYYGLQSATLKDTPQGFEMAMYRRGGPHYPEDVHHPESSPTPLSQQRRSKSTANFLVSKKGQETPNSESDKSNEKLVRRRQKSVGDFTLPTPEKIQEGLTNNTNSSSITVKGLPLKAKSTNRAAAGDGEAGGGLGPLSIGLMDSILTNVVSIVRKSSSATSLQQDSENGNGTMSSIWPDFEALSTVAIARPIFDGLAKPASRRNKAALD